MSEKSSSREQVLSAAAAGATCCQQRETLKGGTAMSVRSAPLCPRLSLAGVQLITRDHSPPTPLSPPPFKSPDSDRERERRLQRIPSHRFLPRAIPCPATLSRHDQCH